MTMMTASVLSTSNTADDDFIKVALFQKSTSFELSQKSDK